MIKKILLGVLIYLIFMVALFPASVALKLAPLPAQIRVAGISGTIWDGQVATLVVQRRQFEQLHWDLDLWRLLQGKLAADITLGNRGSVVSGKGHISWSLGGIQVTDLRFEAPNNFVIGNARLPFHTKIGGEINLIVPQFSQGLPWCSTLQGKVFLNHLSAKNQFGHYPLGNIQLGLSCDAGQLVLNTTEKDNDLGVSAKATLGENSKLLVEGRIRETATQPADLQQALTFLGRPDAQGYYPIRYAGVVPGL